MILESFGTWLSKMTFSITRQWLKRNMLQLALEKTEVLLLKGEQRQNGAIKITRVRNEAGGDISLYIKYRRLQGTDDGAKISKPV